MFITIWEWTGVTFVLYFAAMSQIDPSVLEAARMDGAGNLRTLVSIIWPERAGDHGRAGHPRARSVR